MRSSDKKFFISVIVFLSTIAIGYIGYMTAGWDSLDALYMVIITIFGVGYGEVQEMTPELRIFTIVFIIIGCTSLLYAVGAFINWLTEGQIQQYLGERKMEKEIKNLRNHIIICGYGRVGRVLAEKIEAAGRPFVIIERDADQIDSIRSAGYLYVEGDATEEAILKKAGVKEAKSLATVLPADAANVFIVLSCRFLNDSIRIISRANESSTEAKLIQAGADKVIMPAVIGGDRAANMLLRPTAQEILEKDLTDNIFVEELGGIGLVIEEVKVSGDIAKLTLADLETKSKSTFLVVAVKKNSGKTIVKPDLKLVLDVGDILVVISQKDVPLEFIKEEVSQMSTTEK